MIHTLLKVLTLSLSLNTRRGDSRAGLLLTDKKLEMEKRGDGEFYCWSVDQQRRSLYAEIVDCVW